MRFRHNDMDHFERCLENCPPEEKIFIVSEGVFSMEGDVADLPGILKLAKPYGARTYVDEAHGIGVLGPTGAGAAEHMGVLEDVDIIMGTFSKSLASVGGFIAGEKAVIDYLKHTARPFVFSASLPAVRPTESETRLGSWVWCARSIAAQMWGWLKPKGSAP